MDLSMRSGVQTAAGMEESEISLLCARAHTPHTGEEMTTRRSLGVLIDNKTRKKI